MIRLYMLLFHNRFVLIINLSFLNLRMIKILNYLNIDIKQKEEIKFCFLFEMEFLNL